MNIFHLIAIFQLVSFRETDVRLTFFNHANVKALAPWTEFSWSVLKSIIECARMTDYDTQTAAISLQDIILNFKVFHMPFIVTIHSYLPYII